MSEQTQETENAEFDEGVEDLAAEEAEEEVLDAEGGEVATPSLDEETLARRRAALSQVVQYGDPVLKSRASEITDFDESLSEEIDRMIHLMKDGLGVGLAANQVGKLRRLLVFQTNADAEPQAVVNPKIEWSSDELETATEGCLSISRVVVEVERPLFITVSGQDSGGEGFFIEAAGHEARVLQHEIDHLDGVLILDRTERSQRKGALKALRRGESYSPFDED